MLLTQKLQVRHGNYCATRTPRSPTLLSLSVHSKIHKKFIIQGSTQVRGVFYDVYLISLFF